LPDLKLDELQQGPEKPAEDGSAPRTTPGGARPGPAAVRSFARQAAAAAAPGRLWRDHRLFIIVAAVSLLPRILAALAYRPAMLTADSFLYMQEAAKGTLGEIRPSGYSFFLGVLQYVPHPLLAVTTAQHLLGIAIAALVYGLLRQRGLPAWGATLAALPTLFDPRQIALESYILPDTVYTIVILIAVALLITKRTPRLWQCLVAGLLMAYVTVLRGNGLPLAIVVALYLLIRRVGWRAFTAGAVAFIVPVLSYVVAFHSSYGQFNITNSDGIFLWSRTTSFANCAVIKPPAKLIPLCPNHSTAPPAQAAAWSIPALLKAKQPTHYLWAPDAWWRHDAHPGINAYNNKLGMEFALDAVKAQPLSYLRASAEDELLLFVKNDRPTNLLTLGFTTKPHIPVLPSYYVRDIKAYAGTTANTHIVQPYAYFLFIYQLPVYFPGLVFLAVVVTGLVGVLRRRRQWGGPAALPWVLAALSLILPALLTQALYRYALTAAPLACLAAGLAFVRQRQEPAPAASAVAPAASPSAWPQPAEPGGPVSEHTAAAGPAPQQTEPPDTGASALAGQDATAPRPAAAAAPEPDPEAETGAS
jgi:hypothetical protein